MAQVIRKYSTAGKFGNIVLDGKKHAVTEDWLNAIENQSEQGRAWASALRSGTDRYLYRTADGGFDFAGMGDAAAELGDLNTRQQRKIGLSGRGGSKVNKERAKWHTLGNYITNNLPKSPEPTEFKLSALSLPYFINDEDNTTKYINEGDKIRLADHIKKLQSLKEKDYDKYTFWDNALTKDQILSQLADQTRISNLETAIKNGQLTEENIRDAALLGINITKSDSEKETPKTSLASAGSYTDAKGNIQEIVSSDGQLNPQHPFYNVVKDNPTGTYFFGDSYRQLVPNSDFKEDLFYHNGKLYRDSDKDWNQNALYHQWKELLRQGRFDEANSLIKYNFVEGPSYHPITTEQGSLLYAPDDALMASDVTGYYDAGEGNRVVRFLPKGYEVDKYGFPVLNDSQLHIVDKYNNIINGNIVKRPSTTPHQSNLGYSAAIENPFIDSNELVYRILSAANPEDTSGDNVGIYKVGNNYYYYDRGYNARIKSGSGLGRADQYAVRISPAVLQYLRDNDSILRDYNLRSDLNQLLYSTLRPGGVKVEDGVVDPGFGNRNYEIAPEIMAIVKNNEHLPEGAKLQFKQSGGIFSKGDGSMQQATPTIKTDTRTRGKGEEKIINDGTNFTASEKAELAALGLDGASFLLSFVPGAGQTVGLATGLGGTLAQAYADVNRDGLDWGDVGSFAMNLGMDALSIVGGPATKGIKMAKALAKSKPVAKIVLTAIAGLGAGTAAYELANSWDRLQKGNWKISDIRNILTVVRGASSLTRIHGTATIEDKSPNAKAKIGNSEATIDRETWNGIKRLPVDQQKAKLEAMLPEKSMSNEEAIQRVIEARKQSKADAADLPSVEEAAEILRNESKTPITLKDVGITYKPSKKWKWITYQREKLDYTPKFGETYIDPATVPWYKFRQKYGATVDASMNPNNPYHLSMIYANPQSLIGERRFPLRGEKGESTYVMFRPIALQHFESWNSNEPTPQPLIPRYYYKKGGVVKLEKGGGNVDTTPSPKWLQDTYDVVKNFNFGQALNDTARLANDLNALKKARDYEVDATRKRGLGMVSLLPYFSSVYNFDPILKQRDEAIEHVNNAVRQTAKTQTDQKLASQIGLEGSSQKIGIEEKVLDAMSNEIIQKDALNKERHDQTLRENIGRADQNRQLGAEVAAAIDRINATYTTEKAKTINAVLEEKSKRRAVDQAERAEIEANNTLVDAQSEAEKYLASLPEDISASDKQAYMAYLKSYLAQIAKTAKYTSGYNRNTYISNSILAPKTKILDYNVWKNTQSSL